MLKKGQTEEDGAARDEKGFTRIFGRKSRKEDKGKGKETDSVSDIVVDADPDKESVTDLDMSKDDEELLMGLSSPGSGSSTLGTEGPAGTSAAASLKEEVKVIRIEH
jgi:hypothetical protein